MEVPRGGKYWEEGYMGGRHAETAMYLCNNWASVAALELMLLVEAPLRFILFSCCWINASSLLLLLLLLLLGILADEFDGWLRGCWLGYIALFGWFVKGCFKFFYEPLLNVICCEQAELLPLYYGVTWHRCLR